MPALRKPHRVAFLVPELTVEGSDAASAAEAGLLLWMACIEVCQRHPGLAVLDAESSPLAPQDGHFAPAGARRGATPCDAFHAPSRRDELVWLELALPRSGPVKLHALVRDGRRDTFEAAGRNTGEQIHQVLERWLAARGLGALPRRFDAAEAGEVLAAVRAVAPVLAEQARAQVELVRLGAVWLQLDDAASDAANDAAIDRSELRIEATITSEPVTLGAGEAADGEPRTFDDSATAGDRRLASRRRSARAVAGRLPPALRLPALRLLALALGEDLDDLILAADPDQPQALFGRFRAGLARGRDLALLRRVIASAPGWALPYGEWFATGASAAADAAPSELEVSAAAGIAALCRPDQLAVLATAAARLADAGWIDDGIRLLERAVALHPGSPEAHAALLGLHRRADRPGAWLVQAVASGALHGCPMDPALPCEPDQIQIDLLVADALLHAGRIDEAIALRAARLAGRETRWPRHARILDSWRREPRLLARAYAREAALRGDPGRALHGYATGEPASALDVALMLDALVATGREDEVALAWGRFGLGPQLTSPVARIAAARGLLAAGDWRRGVEELWRVELTEPGRDLQVAIAHAGCLLSAAPLDVLEAALGERLASGALALARRMARDVADFVPGAAKSSIVLRALGRSHPIDLDPAWLAGFAADLPSRRAIDAMFADAAEPRPGAGSAAAVAAPAERSARGDRLVNAWIEVVFTEVAIDDAAGIAQAAAYLAAQALGRYLAATAALPSPLAGALRTVAAEALALVWRHRAALADREVRALLGALDPLLRRVDRWLGAAWLGAIERSCALDERAGGDVAGFAHEYPTIAARALGPEETAVLASSIARLGRERRDGWTSATAAQAARLVLHTGGAGAPEWAEAVVAQLAAAEIEVDDAIDVLHTACYLSEGRSAVPSACAAHVLIAAGRAAAAQSVLSAGLAAAAPAWRTAQLAALAEAGDVSRLDAPLDRARLVAQLDAALAAGDLARAEKLGRLAVAVAPEAAAAHRGLGLAFAGLGKLPEALQHLVASAPAHAAELLVRAGSQAAAAAAQRPSAFTALEAGDMAAAAALLDDPRWRIRRAALAAARYRTASESTLEVAPRARAAAAAVLDASAGAADRDALIARALALAIREQAYFAREPAAQLGDRMTPEGFHRELRARGGTAPEDAPPTRPSFVDRIAVPDGRLARVSDYVALIRDLAELTPAEALAEFDLDEAGYLEVAAAWSVAIAADPTLVATIAAGLAKR